MYTQISQPKVDLVFRNIPSSPDKFRARIVLVAILKLLEYAIMAPVFITEYTESTSRVMDSNIWQPR